MPAPSATMVEFPKHPFLLTFEEAAQALGTDVDKGLTSAQVADLQAKFPPNELDVGGTVPWYKIFAKQLFNAMIIVSGTYTSSGIRWISATVLRSETFRDANSRLQRALNPGCSGTPRNPVHRNTEWEFDNITDNRLLGPRVCHGPELWHQGLH
jgi:hypothetical protein